MNPARRRREELPWWSAEALSCRGGVRREELPRWSAEALHPDSCSFSGRCDTFEKLPIRGHDDEKLRIGASNRSESCDSESPIGTSTIQPRVEQRADEQTSKGPDADGGGNLKLTVLPQPFRTLLHCGMKYLFRVEGGARVHDWVSVCLSSEIRSEMVTPEELKFFIKDLVCKGEAIGMDFYPVPWCSMWPRIFGPLNKSMFQLENALVLAELAALLRFLEIHGKMVQLVLIVLPHLREGANKRLHATLMDTLMDIRILCAKHGVIYHECFSCEVRMRSNTYMDFTTCEIKEKAVYLDFIKNTGGDSKAAHINSGKEIGDGGSKELWLDVHASVSPNVSDDETQEDDSSDKEQGGDGGSEHESSASGSPNVSDDETQEDDSSDKEQGGDGGSEHESSTHSDSFPGSVDEAESEDELPTDNDGGFHGSVDETECIDHSILQVKEKGNVKTWAYISFSMSLKETIKFLRKLIGTCIGMGMGFNQFAVDCLHVKPGSFDVEEALWHMHDGISQIFSVHGGELKLLFVILPDKEVGDETYDRIEKVCDKLGFVYQCCSPEDARNPRKGYLQTTAYKINDKVVRRDAGVLQCNFVMPFSAEDDDPTIVFGADICCDSNISVESVVATFDWPVSSRYNGFVAEKPYKEVTIKSLHNENGSMVRHSLCAFFEYTKEWPCRIIFFRNGADEGQLSFILSQEIDAIRKACISILTRTLLITYVVVGRAESAVGEGGCCPAEFEFSCSHPVVGGTGTNDVAYRVLHDENQYDADELQSLCINLCTNRVRWSHPEVSMAPPAYYAHLAASRAHAQLVASRVNEHVQESCNDESTT